MLNAKIYQIDLKKIIKSIYNKNLIDNIEEKSPS